MTLDKKKVLAAAIGCALCLTVIGCIAIGFYIGKGIYDQPIHESITRDTVTRIDTVFQYFPKPVEVERIRTEYKWLTKVATDTVTDYTVLHDSVLVEVPIESKHYNSPEYDAWVSGYQPSLDSIRVYQKENYITERVTVSKPPNRFTLGLQGGYGYGFKSKQWEPYVGIGVGIRIF